MKNKVSLQINLAPVDFPHARYILPHQLSALAEQVNEIILTIDTRPSKGRFGDGWTENVSHLNDFLSNDIKAKYNVKVVMVDYSDSAKKNIAQYFFGTNYIPEKDFRGGPFYAYFFGLYTAVNKLVLHLDADIFIGGGSSVWIDEAVQFFEADPSCLITGPLPGPPNKANELTDQHIIDKIAPYTWQLDGMSTRIFLINKSQFDHCKLTLKKPPLRGQIKALIDRNSNADLPEHLISAYMREHNLKRIDFLGTGNGLWSLHPPYRTTAFYEQLPEIIRRVETNDLPQKQQGFYDIIDEVCDWKEAREKLQNNRWWKR